MEKWKHRSKEMKCKTCMWLSIKPNAIENENKVGRCRRHSPSMNGYPVVYTNNDWCGDHKLDENKI